MEWKNRSSSTRKRKADTFSTTSLDHAEAHIVFGLFVASLAKSQNYPSSSKFLLKRCVNKILHSLLSESSNCSPLLQNLISPLLSLLPVLLNSKCAEIASRGAEIAGATSLRSFEMNENIASDYEIMKGLISAVSNLRRNVSMAACNAILDLSTTSTGRFWLLEYSAVENLIFGFLQVPKSSTISASLYTLESGDDTSPRLKVNEDEHALLLLEATLSLINSSSMVQIEKIPINLSGPFLAYLKELWAKVRYHILWKSVVTFQRETHFNTSNIGTSSLAESIFRLSRHSSEEVPRSLPSGVLKEGIFGSNDCAFQRFISNHWETSPLFISNALNEQACIYDSLKQSINYRNIFSSMLQNSVSCLPITSDELDILSFLKEVKHNLGCPLIYLQDIRVVKKDKHSNKESHFFKNSSSHVLYVDDILKCEEAYKNGYTIALRGLEFRSESIADIVDALASIFGQPSAGANVYLTPPNSQGLTCHYDDHCVLVCQLFGSKKWKVSSEANVSLPRLYESCDGVKSSDVDDSLEFCLKEGDVLYIPRGFLHEAYTVADNKEAKGSDGFSLHLTLSIEVEPPFEWEGFAHTAVHCWKQMQPKHKHDVLNMVSVNLLHLSIMLIGNSDPIFRKACLVAALSSTTGTENWLYMNQKIIFNHIIDRIDKESRFLISYKYLEMAVQKHEDLFQWTRWLRHISWEEETMEGNETKNPLIGIEEFLHCCDCNKDKVEATFVLMKSKFCKEIVFEVVEERYRKLLDMYKKARRQYTHGMLSLHCI